MGKPLELLFYKMLQSVTLTHSVSTEQECALLSVVKKNNPLKPEMRKFFGKRNKTQSNDSKKPLIENNNNNNIQEGYDLGGHGYENPLARNTFNTEEEQCLQREKDITLKELAQLLGVSFESIYNPTEDSCCSVWLESNLGQDSKKPCTVHGAHHQTLMVLNILLQKASSAKDYFLLMNWVRQKYLRQEMLHYPHCRKFFEWEAKGKSKLLECVQTEIRGSLDKILLNETCKDNCKEEHFIKLYVDAIQCINAMPCEAQKICPELPEQVNEVCFQELLTFVRRYTAEQTEDLQSKAKMDKPETIHFLKTLKTCKELRKYVRDESKGVPSSLTKEIVSILENMEAFTLELLRKIVTDIAERHLKIYFRSDTRLIIMLDVVRNHFPMLPFVLDELKVVVNETYKIIAHTYLKHLIQCSRHKLRSQWCSDVGQRITEDANQLHATMSDIVPDIQEHELLLRVREALDCNPIDGLKMVMGRIEHDHFPQSEDSKLLYTLLRWKGLSKSKVREVLDALPSSESRPRSRSCFSCLFCW